MPVLVVLAAGELYVRDGLWKVPRKFLTGMHMYASLFPGEVWVMGKPAPQQDDENLDSVTVTVEDLPFGCSITEDLDAGLRELRPDIALLALTEEQLRLVGHAKTSILSAEHAARSWLAMSLAHQHSALDRLRMEVGYRRLERRLVRGVTRADGIHCNGPVAWTTYAAHSRSSLRVYDSRLTPDLMDAANVGGSHSVPGAGTPTRPVRLGFSGRLTAIKGPQHAVVVPELLALRGITSSLDVYGTGPLQPELTELAGPDVRFHGSVGFDEWCRRAQQLDLMLLPHVQPDPSGTYLESAGLGVPVVGFDNEALVDLSRHGFAFPVHSRRSEHLANRVAALARDPAMLGEARLRGIRFMQQNHFRADFTRRVDHMLALAGRD